LHAVSSLFLLPLISSIAWRWHCNSMTSTSSLLLAVCSVLLWLYGVASFVLLWSMSRWSFVHWMSIRVLVLFSVRVLVMRRLAGVRPRLYCRSTPSLPHSFSVVYFSFLSSCRTGQIATLLWLVGLALVGPFVRLLAQTLGCNVAVQSRYI
jgi:hypothetical protein